MLTQTFPLELLISPGSILIGHLHTFCYVPLYRAPSLGSHRTSVRFSIAVERSQPPSFWLTLYQKVFLSVSIFKNPRETLFMGRDYLLPVNFNYLGVICIYEEHAERDPWGLLLQRTIRSADDTFWRQRGERAGVTNAAQSGGTIVLFFSPCSSLSGPVLIILSCPI